MAVTNILTKYSIIYYNSISEEGRALNVDRFTISRRIKDKKILKDLYLITYLKN